MKYNQKKKQNQRILGITDQTLVIGADIAKETHIVRAIDYRGIELGQDLEFTNDADGFANLMSWIKRAETLVQAATTSIGLTEGLSAARIELTALLEQYELYTRQVEGIMNEVESLLTQIPGSDEMLTVPGIGIVTLAGFLAETGDLNKYDHGQQIIRLAGFNLRENSSGKKKGKTTISKRGRSRLRAILFRAVLPMVAKNPEFKALHHYYTQRSINPLKKKQSLIALCGKLIRVLYTLGTKQISYHATDVLGPVRQAQLQAVA